MRWIVTLLSLASFSIACESPRVPNSAPASQSRAAGAGSFTSPIDLFNVAVDLERRGNYRQALDNLQLAIPAFYRLEDREWVVRSLLLWVEATSFNGDIHAVADSLASAARLINGSEQPGDLKALYFLEQGLAAVVAGEMDVSARVLLKASTYADSVGAEALRGKADCIRGWVMQEQGDYERAIDHLQSVMAGIDRAYEDDLLNLAYCSNQLGLAYWSSGSLALAERYIRQALTLRSALLGNNNPIVNAASVNLGIVLYTRGNYLEALRLFESEIDERDDHFPSDEDLARAYSNIGLVYWKIGDPARAIDLLKRSEDIRLRLQGSDHPQIDIVYNRLGLAYHDLGMYPLALEYHMKSFERKLAMGATHPELAHAYNNMGLTLLEMGQLDSAREYFHHALALRATASRNHPDLAINYGNLAETYERDDDWPAALALYQTALRIHLSTAGHRGEDIANTYRGLARARMHQGRFDLAIAALDSAVIAVTQEHETTRFPSYAGLLALYEKARLIENSGSRTAALNAYPIYRDAIDHWMRLRTDPRYDQSNSANVASGVALVSNAFENALHLYRETNSQVYFNSLLQYSELEHRSSLFDGFGSESRISDYLPDSVMTKERAWRTRIVELEMSSPLRHDSTQMSLELFEARRKYDQFMRFLERNYPAYYEYRHNDVTTNGDAVVAQLDRDEALIEFFETPDSLYVITLTKTASGVHSVDAGRIRKEIATYLSTLRTREDDGYRESAYALFRWLLEPVQHLIVGKDLVIVPDGSLHFVPLEALLTRPPAGLSRRYDLQPYLVLDHAVEYSYSATLRSYVRDRNRGIPTMKFLGVAPAFHNGSASWPDVRMDTVNYLPGSVREVQSIYRMFVPWYDVIGRGWRRNSTFLQGNMATEEGLRSSDPGAYKFLHFATHGSFDGESPAVSGLLMYRGSVLQDDVLRLGEIYGFTLSADLVVVSACDSGLGKLVAGENVIGLAGGFLYAGARNVVVSLWQVDDRSAVELMRNFYGQSQRTQNYRVALRSAKMELIANGGRYSRPYHWASYILFGS